MKDKDLDFLRYCTNDQLKLLADFMLYDKDGKLRWTEQISSTQAFKLYYPHDMVKLVPLLIDELQRFGGNTVFNFFRGHGVSYREILRKVCKKLRVPYNDRTPMEVIERRMLKKLLVKSVEQMTEEDLHHLKMSKGELIEKINNEKYILSMTGILVAQMAVNYGLKQGVGWVAKYVGGRAFALAGIPIVNIVLAVLLVFDIAGPAYRVLIPCTIVIAYLRMIYNTPEFGKFDEPEPVLEPVLV